MNVDNQKEEETKVSGTVGHWFSKFQSTVFPDTQTTIQSLNQKLKRYQELKSRSAHLTNDEMVEKNMLEMQAFNIFYIEHTVKTSLSKTTVMSDHYTQQQLKVGQQFIAQMVVGQFYLIRDLMKHHLSPKALEIIRSKQWANDFSWTNDCSGSQPCQDLFMVTPHSGWYYTSIKPGIRSWNGIDVVADYIRHIYDTNYYKLMDKLYAVMKYVSKLNHSSLKIDERFLNVKDGDELQEVVYQHFKCTGSTFPAIYKGISRAFPTALIRSCLAVLCISGAGFAYSHLLQPLFADSSMISANLQYQMYQLVASQWKHFFPHWFDKGLDTYQYCSFGILCDPSVAPVVIEVASAIPHLSGWKSWESPQSFGARLFGQDEHPTFLKQVIDSIDYPKGFGSYKSAMFGTNGHLSQYYNTLGLLMAVGLQEKLLVVEAYYDNPQWNGDIRWDTEMDLTDATVVDIIFKNIKLIHSFDSSQTHYNHVISALLCEEWMKNDLSTMVDPFHCGFVLHTSQSSAQSASRQLPSMDAIFSVVRPSAQQPSIVYQEEKSIVEQEEHSMVHQEQQFNVHKPYVNQPSTESNETDTHTDIHKQLKAMYDYIVQHSPDKISHDLICSQMKKLNLFRNSATNPQNVLRKLMTKAFVAKLQLINIMGEQMHTNVYCALDLLFRVSPMELDSFQEALIKFEQKPLAKQPLYPLDRIMGRFLLFLRFYQIFEFLRQLCINAFPIPKSRADIPQIKISVTALFVLYFLSNLLVNRQMTGCYNKNIATTMKNMVRIASKSSKFLFTRIHNEGYEIVQHCREEIGAIDEQIDKLRKTMQHLKKKKKKPTQQQQDDLESLMQQRILFLVESPASLTPLNVEDDFTIKLGDCFAGKPNEIETVYDSLVRSVMWLKVGGESMQRMMHDCYFTNLKEIGHYGVCELDMQLEKLATLNSAATIETYRSLLIENMSKKIVGKTQELVDFTVVDVPVGVQRRSRFSVVMTYNSFLQGRFAPHRIVSLRTIDRWHIANKVYYPSIFAPQFNKFQQFNSKNQLLKSIQEYVDFPKTPNLFHYFDEPSYATKKPTKKTQTNTNVQSSFRGWRNSNKCTNTKQSKQSPQRHPILDTSQTESKNSSKSQFNKHQRSQSSKSSDSFQSSHSSKSSDSRQSSDSSQSSHSSKSSDSRQSSDSRESSDSDISIMTNHKKNLNINKQKNAKKNNKNNAKMNKQKNVKRNNQKNTQRKQIANNKPSQKQQQAKHHQYFPSLESPNSDDETRLLSTAGCYITHQQNKGRKPNKQWKSPTKQEMLQSSNLRQNDWGY